LRLTVIQNIENVDTNTTILIRPVLIQKETQPDHSQGTTKIHSRSIESWQTIICF